MANTELVNAINDAFISKPYCVGMLGLLEQTVLKKQIVMTKPAVICLA